MPEQMIAIELIQDNPYQPRTTDNAEHLEALARSIAADGLLQKPTVRPITDGTYQLAFGHSRRKAFEWLKANYIEQGLPERYNGYSTMPVEVEDLGDEEMYRNAVTENVQRKDLDPIELAKSMTVYRDLFGKTSDEIGALFGMNGATIRGKLRLLDLPEEVRTELATGAISEGAARDILSLQKVASTTVIQKTVEQIKKGLNDWGVEVTPREIIADTIEDLENVEQLTFASDDGKKPTVKHGGWALDIKKFPNQYLPLLTGHIAVQALDCINDKPAQKLVLEIAQYLDADTATDVDKEYHEANKNQIQKRMEQLAEINSEYSQRLQLLINPPTCSACPSMTKFDDRYFCGMKACYERKVSAWQKHGMFAGAKTLGVEIYDPQRDGDYLVLEDTYRNDKHKDLWRKKNKDLRLAFMADIDRKKYQSGYDKCPNGCVVLVVGKTLEKLQEVKEQMREEKRTDMKEVRNDMMQDKINELLWDATAYLKPVLDGIPNDAINSLYDAPRYGWDHPDALPDPDFSGNEDEKIISEHVRREIILHMLMNGDDAISDDPDNHETLAELVSEIQKRTKAWKIKLPAELAKRAAKCDAEIAEAVATETKKGKKK